MREKERKKGKNDRSHYIKDVPKLTQDLNLPPFLHQVVGNPDKRTCLHY